MNDEMVTRPEGGDEPERDAQLAMGIRPSEDGAVGFLSIDGHSVSFDADMADQLAADLRNIAVELRNGGRLG